jgi:hypothetical protein
VTTADHAGGTARAITKGLHEIVDGVFADLQPDGGWAGRTPVSSVAVNVETVYRSLDPGHTSPPVPELFRRMAELER